MNATFHTLIYSAPRMEIEELMYVRKQLAGLLGKDFVKLSDEDESCVNKIVHFLANSNFFLDSLEHKLEDPWGR